MSRSIEEKLKSMRRAGPGWLPWNRSRQTLLELRELRYERLFSNALLGAGIASRYYPLKSAANYSLLYLIQRIVSELPVRRVWELGCGQSTLLLDDWSRLRALEVTTLEQDPDWAARIQAQVAHRILQTPLLEKRIRGRRVHAYAPSAADLGARPDLLIVDGPVGQKRFSRWGALEYIEASLSGDLILLFDDVERQGEQDTVLATLQLLAERHIEYRLSLTRALKSQCLIATGALRPACYF